MSNIIGILALQGSFAEHAEMLKKLNYKIKLIRKIDDTNDVSSCIIPGGESTTMLKLLEKTGLNKWLQDSAKQGMPIYGTCAGMIILSEFGLIDIKVDRNAYGSQLNSFETELDMKGKKIKGVFIRAPKIVKLGVNVEILSQYDSNPVLVRDQNIMVGSFHPELTNDPSVHQEFLRDKSF